MIRTFQPHYIRKTQLLDGAWDFAIDPDDVGRKERWEQYFPENCRKAYVPSCWNNESDLYEYEGVAWYRTTVHAGDASQYRLAFHGVQGSADIYWDGDKIASHYGGFTPIECILSGVSPGPHELVVRTDSTLDELTLPYRIVDWFHYGGITRSVEWQPLADAAIDDLRIAYEIEEDGSRVEAACAIALRSFLPEEIVVPIRLELDGESVWNGDAVVAPGGSSVVEARFTVENARLWNVGAPELYYVRAVLPGDDRVERIGFRRIETGNKQIRINGKPVYLKGINRHEEHPEWGFAVPPKLMHKDMDILKRLGCNAVRGSHYPQSPYWLDLLDENGIVFWGEIPIWGAHLPLEPLQSPVVVERASTMLREMIRRDRHHPCVIMWGIHNEIDTRSRIAYDFSVPLIEAVRSEDVTRPIVYATMHPDEDIVLPLVDIVGINKYYGWYGGDVSGFEGMLERFHARMEQFGCTDKPVLMSEFGAAGVFGETGFEPRIFSEDYQNEVVEKALRIFLADKNVCGTFVWHFADIRVNLRKEHLQFRDRARSFNNKGLLNEYRKPKTAFRTVQAIYKNIP
ncbi:beta-glucuronidase [Paenibacillus antri]|uniref:Beta-glucuronidase n=1 Tax=Paenibacillus antri TaxID=2582848 RepID=A0A5R9GHV6_9BACL|nr:glycoside hydrolase family 2 TIM barrel-domain containing protein [Paenibacillus antri]TLS53830.1 beta-glucuronidase [Paenibacillus antri]